MADAPPATWHLIAFLGGITALAAFSTDISVPALGVIAEDFNRPSGSGGLLIGVLFVSYGVGQLFWGVFSDAYGRKPALILSLSGFALASFACAVAPDFTILLVARTAQGLMMGAPVIARAIVRDTMSGREMARLMALLGAILTGCVLAAPLLGSLLLVVATWHSHFLLLGALGAGMSLYAAFAFGETVRARRPERFSFGFVAQSTRFLMTTRPFMFPALILCFTFGGYASLGAVGAVVAEEQFGVGPSQFGLLFAIAAIANLTAAFFARRLLGFMAPRKVNRIGVSILGIAGLVHAAISFADPGLVAYWAAVCLYVFAFGMVLPVSFALALEPAGRMPGFAAAVVGMAYTAAATMVVFMVTHFFDGSHRTISVAMAVMAASAVAVRLVSWATEPRG
ncbi:MAG: MFS transporter [Rhodobacteraceae bacterium]|nr:MFS transporter [Paracoccaceae bacterium]